MKYILTLFDYGSRPPTPIQSIVMDDNDVRFYTFYFPGIGFSIKEIEDNIAKFKTVFDDKVYINDFKSHLSAFKLDDFREITECTCSLPDKVPVDDLACKKILAKAMSDVIVDDSSWRIILPKAAQVYFKLEDNWIWDGQKKQKTCYDLLTFSGRSRTTGFNVQGVSSDRDVRPIDVDRNVFVHFDWISADFRMASYMSSDRVMEGSFVDSDPYALMSRELGDEFSRDVCKKALLKTVYSLSVESPVLNLFPTFKEWMIDRLEFLKINKYLESLLGRKFCLSDEHDRQSVFNCQFQGSVVHAMQATLIRLPSRCLNCLFAEIHDSLVFVCSEDEVLELVSDVSNIMISPLDEYVDRTLRMPLKVNVGKKWKKWVHLETIR